MKEQRDQTHLLDQQLRSIRDRQLHNPLAVLAFWTPIGVTEHTALFAYLRFESVRGDHESFEEELGGAVPDKAGISTWSD